MEYIKSVICAVFMLELIVMPCLGQNFISEAQGLFVMQGSDVTLFCKVNNLGAKNVIWSHDGAFLAMNHMVIGGDTSRLKIRGKYNLRITNVSLADTGKYVCQVSSVPAITQASFINVTVPSTVELLNDTEIEATLKDNITFKCSARGKPQPNITWSREDAHLPNGKDYLEGDTLTLTAIQYDHGGVYRCTAFNGYGQPDTDTVKLNIFYSPKIHSKSMKVHTGPGIRTKIPCIVSGQPRPLVEWKHNGSIINLRHLAQHKEMMYVEKGFNTDFSLIIRGVQDDDLGTYACRVNNEKGSDSAKITLTAKPGNVKITSTEESKYSNVYQLTWNVTSVVLPSKYRLMYREVNETVDGNWTEVDIDAKAKDGRTQHSQIYEIIDLVSDTSYEVVVRAYNHYGWGGPSKKFEFTTNMPGFNPPPTPRAPSVRTHSRGERVYDQGNYGNRLFPWQQLTFLTFILALLSSS